LALADIQEEPLEKVIFFNKKKLKKTQKNSKQGALGGAWN
jgi:hypothetical protein